MKLFICRQNRETRQLHTAGHSDKHNISAVTIAIFGSFFYRYRF